MEKWEYTSTDNEFKLDELGQKGWELVSAVKLYASDSVIRFYLKRKIAVS